MVSGSECARFRETSSEEAWPLVYDGVSDPEGIWDSEESEVDRLLVNKGECRE